MSWTTFVDVFHSDFWLTILGGSLVSGLVIFVLFRHETNINLSTSLSIVCLSFLALNIPEYPKRIPGRIFTFNILILGALTYWSYNAILVSLVTVDKFSYPITKLEDLLEDSSYHLLVEAGSAYVDYFKLASEETNPVAKALWDKVVECIGKDVVRKMMILC